MRAVVCVQDFCSVVLLLIKKKNKRQILYKWLEELLLLKVIYLSDRAPKYPTSFYMQLCNSQRFLILLRNISDTSIFVNLPFKSLKKNSEYKAFIDVRIKIKNKQKQDIELYSMATIKHI